MYLLKKGTDIRGYIFNLEGKFKKDQDSGLKRKKSRELDITDQEDENSLSDNFKCYICHVLIKKYNR